MNLETCGKTVVIYIVIKTRQNIHFRITRKATRSIFSCVFFELLTLFFMKSYHNVKKSKHIFLLRKVLKTSGRELIIAMTVFVSFLATLSRWLLLISISMVTSSAAYREIICLAAGIHGGGGHSHAT